MKTIILAVVLVLALAAPIEFAQDSNSESAISLFTKGFFDPTATGEAKIETFLRLANELIPLTEVTGETDAPKGKKIGVGYTYCTGSTGSLFNACFYANA